MSLDSSYQNTILITAPALTQVLLFSGGLISLNINSDAVTSKNTLTRDIFPTWMHNSVGCFGLGFILTWQKCQTEGPSLFLNFGDQRLPSLTAGSLIHCLRVVVEWWLLFFFLFILLPSRFFFFSLAVWYFVIWKLNDTLISSTNGKLSTWNLVNLKEVKCSFCQCTYLETSCQCNSCVHIFLSLNRISFFSITVWKTKSLEDDSDRMTDYTKGAHRIVSMP